MESTESGAVTPLLTLMQHACMKTESFCFAFLANLAEFFHCQVWPMDAAPCVFVYGVHTAEWVGG
jgi:hypothetical protein